MRIAKDEMNTILFVLITGALLTAIIFIFVFMAKSDMALIFGVFVVIFIILIWVAIFSIMGVTKKLSKTAEGILILSALGGVVSIVTDYVRTGTVKETNWVAIGTEGKIFRPESKTLALGMAPDKFFSKAANFHEANDDKERPASFYGLYKKKNDKKGNEYELKSLGDGFSHFLYAVTDLKNSENVKYVLKNEKMAYGEVTANSMREAGIFNNITGAVGVISENNFLTVTFKKEDGWVPDNRKIEDKWGIYIHVSETGYTIKDKDKKELDSRTAKGFNKDNRAIHFLKANGKYYLARISAADMSDESKSVTFFVLQVEPEFSTTNKGG